MSMLINQLIIRYTSIKYEVKNNLIFILIIIILLVYLIFYILLCVVVGTINNIIEFMCQLLQYYNI